MHTPYFPCRFAGCLLAALVLFSNCRKEDAELVDRTLPLAAFEGLEVRVGANVELSEGPTQKVEVRGSADFVNRLHTTVDNGTWKAEVDGTVRDQSQATIRVTLPRRRLVMAGAGAVRGLTAFTGPALDVAHSGSGSVLLVTNATDLAVTLSGSGPVELAGTAANQTVRLSGSVDILPGLKARGFPSALDAPSGTQDIGSGVPVPVVPRSAATTVPRSDS